MTREESQEFAAGEISKFFPDAKVVREKGNDHSFIVTPNNSSLGFTARVYASIMGPAEQARGLPPISRWGIAVTSEKQYRGPGLTPESVSSGWWDGATLEDAWANISKHLVNKLDSFQFELRALTNLAIALECYRDEVKI